MRSLLHVCMPPDNTISILRLWKIAIVSAIAFGVGYACMAMLNGVGYILAGAAGAHPTGRGNTSSQLITGGVFAVIGAVVATWWTRKSDQVANGPRVHQGAVAIALVVAIVTPLGIVSWRDARAAAAEREQLLHSVVSGGEGSLMAADTLARTSGGVEALRRLLGDVGSPAEARLVAGLELSEYRVATPADEAQVEALIRRPSPLRGRFVEIYAGDHFSDWSDSIERWMVTVLDDPEPAMRLGALRALVGNSVDGPHAPEACPALHRLARDSDPNVRAEAMLMASACPRDRIPASLKEGTSDPDPAVRLAVLKRLQWRFGGTDDTPADTAIRRELASTLLHDPDPAVRAAAVARHAGQ